MALSDEDIRLAEKTAQDERESGPRAVAARYDRRRARVVVSLSNGLEVAFPPGLVEGLEAGAAEDLANIEISPSGLGLHWPGLDADLWLPALLQGVFGSPRWMTGLADRKGTPTTAAARRTNGLPAGRPRKLAV